ncbi:MAG: polysaccharide deacetylase family protein [Muribaculaceae bacterium]|nr:polysaccharide deacetylase family protein [Muribaculaceae bacterium]
MRLTRLIERPPGWFRKLVKGGEFRLPSTDGKKRVYLTFDDGPIPEVTPLVLDILDRYGVKATFFMVGQNVERHPELLDEIRRRGHGVGNHTLHHLQGLKSSTEDYLEDVEAAGRLIGGNLFRPPHGWLRPAQARALRAGYRIIMYDLVTRDYSKWLSPEDVVRNVKELARDGSVIVFHDSIKSWPRLQTALPAALEWLIAEDYEFGLI